MKVEIELDVSPEEVRTLLGLPDLQPIHAIYIDRMKSFVEKGVTPELMTEMVKSWSSFGGAGMGLIQQLLGGVASGMTGGARRAASEDDAPKGGNGKR